MSVSLMFRKVKAATWSATIQKGRSHVIVGLVPEGWKASLFFRDAHGDLQIREFGIFGSRREAQDGASEAILEGGWRDE